ncbi:Immunoglobulin lambda variable 1-40 [Solea senegalensis]|nr:Immunoglobulin lambda variable 1-40 [Solea senegalensis]
MDKIIIALSLSLLWTPGFFAGTDVTQTPILWKNKGDNNATIHCSHTKGELYFQMYWFRQLPGETMELIVLTTSANKDFDFGDFSKEKFSADKPDARSGTFTVKNLESGDKGLYFCALPGNKGASDTNRVVQIPPFITKRSGESVDKEINCSHSISSYDAILWYKQDQDNLEILGYINTNFPYPEVALKGKINFNGDGRSHSSLTINRLSVNDSGVYFCAASQHSASLFPTVNTKTPALSLHTNQRPHLTRHHVIKERK